MTNPSRGGGQFDLFFASRLARHCLLPSVALFLFLRQLFLVGHPVLGPRLPQRGREGEGGCVGWNTEAVRYFLSGATPRHDTVQELPGNW